MNVGFICSSYFYYLRIYIRIYIVVVVVPVEMWKTHLNVAVKGVVFHSPCGKRCGKVTVAVENS